MELSNREKQVLRLIVQEYSSHEIAKQLEISKRTVDTHRKNISKKIDSHSLVGVTKYAIRHQLIDGYRFAPDHHT